MLNRVTLQLFAYLFTLFLLSCSESETTNVDDSRFPLAAQQNIDAAQLEAAYDEVERMAGNTYSLLVSRNGVLVAEDYFMTANENTLFEVRSVTKSVVSALIGIAIEQGHITSAEQTIDLYFPEYVDDNDTFTSQTTIGHLLSMSGGFYYNEFTQPTSYMDWYRSSDKLAFMLNSYNRTVPGQEFSYHSGVTHLLSAIITKTTGMSTFDYAKQYLFEPMGIDSLDWTFLDNYYHGGAGLYIRGKDMIKFGELYLNNGSYNGQQIVPADWVSLTTTQKLPTYFGGYSDGYGYGWWMDQVGQNSYFFANGWGGQLIICVPRLNLVVSASSNWRSRTTEEANYQWITLMNIIWNQIIPAVR